MEHRERGARVGFRWILLRRIVGMEVGGTGLRIVASDKLLLLLSGAAARDLVRIPVSAVKVIVLMLLLNESMGTFKNH